MTQAEELDRAIDAVLDGARPAVGTELLPLMRVAEAVRAAVAPQPVAPAFEQRLAARLVTGSGGRLTVPRLGEIRPSGRLVATGAVGSAAIGLAGVTAYAVWRVAHR